MKRRKFIKRAAAGIAAGISAPYILPAGSLFAPTGARIANHVVFVLFAGGLRNQETVEQAYLMDQGSTSGGNIMSNMLVGSSPSSNLVHTPWAPILTNKIEQSGTLFKEVTYAEGPTGHYNGHTVALTGKYTQTGLNLNINPTAPTIFEYYRKHNDPVKSAINAWWISEALGPYPSLNYSRHPAYGPAYGANFLNPQTILGNAGFSTLDTAQSYQPDDVARIDKIRGFLNKNFDKAATDLPGIVNSSTHREQIKSFLLDSMAQAQNGSLEFPVPANNYNLLTGDLTTLGSAWHVMKEFRPELMVVNTLNSDICHADFSGYLNFLHKADYGVGWLWNKIQSDPVLANDTIMICMPEHGRNAVPNDQRDGNGYLAYDHTSDANSRRLFTLIAGPPGMVKHGQVLGSLGNPAAESIDVVPTIAKILGFDTDVPAGMLSGRALTEAFV